MRNLRTRMGSMVLSAMMIMSLLPASAMAQEVPPHQPINHVAALTTETQNNVQENNSADVQTTPASQWDGTSVDTSWYDGDSQEKTFTITTAAQLAGLARLVNEGTTNFKGWTIYLGSDIDLCGQEWTPVGGTNTGKKFEGTFDGGNGAMGGNYTISHLKITKGLINTAANNCVGLFGACTGAAKLQNFNLNHADVQGSLNVAAVLGGCGGAEAKITNVHVTGNVRVYGYWYVGGILGKGYSTVSNCSVEGDGTDHSYVKGSDAADGSGYVGGVVGYMGEGSCVTDHCTVKNITVSGTYNGIGGIHGILHYGNTMSDCTLENVVVWQTGEPDAGTGRIYCGAFAGTYLDNSGKNEPTLRDCEFTGELYSGPDKNDVLEAGRYVGSLWYGAEPPANVNITNCKIHMPPVAQVGGEKYETLNEAIDHAKNGDTIRILGDVALTGTINVQKDLVFEGVTKADGSKPVISGKNDLFSQTGSAVYTLRNLELKISESKSNGSYFYHTHNTLTIENCDFTAAGTDVNVYSVVMSGADTADSETCKLIFKNNTVKVNARSALAGLGNGSVVTGNQIDLISERYSGSAGGQTNILTLCATGEEGRDGVTIKNNLFQNANCGIAVDLCGLNGSKIVIEDNKFEQVRFALALSPEKNANCGTYDVSCNTYSFTDNGQTITELKVQDADSNGDKFIFGEGSTEYMPQGASQVITEISVVLDKSSAVLYSNSTPNTVQLTAAVKPDGTNKTVTWTSSNPGVASVSQNGLVTAVGNGTAVITAKVGPAEAVCTVTVSTYFSGGGSSSGDKTEITTNPDGSTTTTVTKPNGTVSQTTKWPDGSSEVVETQKNGTTTTTTTDKTGNKTEVVEHADGSSLTTVSNQDGSASTTRVSWSGAVEAEVTLPESVILESVVEGRPVSLPMPQVPVTSNLNQAAKVTVNLSGSTGAKVEIPVKDVTAGTVAVRVLADGTEQVIKTTLATENGVTVTLSDGETVKIVDNAKEFVDVADNYWGSRYIDFATSRELFSGTSVSTFAPEAVMTRGMIVTVLAAYDGADTTADVGEAWYAPGRQWAMDHGVSDGTNMNGGLTREQLAVMLWSYAGKPASSGDLSRFADADDAGEWAVQALAWAVENGLISGMDGNKLNPQGRATRAQVATIMSQFVALTAG